MPKIALIGANGQVGAEVAAYLSASRDVEIVGVVRSEFGAPLLKLLGVPYRLVDYADAGSLRAAIGDCDLVADFSYPSGALGSLRDTVERNIRAVVAAMPRGRRYILMSSIMAFGMAPESTHIHDVKIARSAYAEIKRRAEECARRAGRDAGVEVFIFRLSQVHGVLQSVTQHFRDQLARPAICEAASADEPTNTVVVCSVAEAIERCATTEHEAGLYTIVSTPQWTLRELHDYYRARYATSAEVLYRAPRQPRWRGLDLQRLKKYRHVLEAQVLVRVPSLAPRLKGIYRLQHGAAERPRSAPVPFHHTLGLVPGRVWPVSSSREAVLAADRAVEARIQSAIDRSRA